MIVFSDLHLKEESEDVCFRVLDKIAGLALENDQIVVFAGDFWHIRYALNVRLLNRVHETLQKWVRSGIRAYILPGNHDQIDVDGNHALAVFHNPPYINVFTEPGISELGDGFVPYRKDINQQLADLKAVCKEVPSHRRVFGHFGIVGAMMNNFKANEHGITAEMIPRPVILGHYHQYQCTDKYTYVGSPYQQNFGEAGKDCFALRFSPMGIDRVDMADPSIPTYHVVKWDPSNDSAAPNRPGSDIDKVRLDVVVDSGVSATKFKKALKSAGYHESTIINPVVKEIDRSVKFEVQEGESLVDSAKRFAQDQSDDAPRLITALERWV